MSGAPDIEVLLATYNGERFLREQIDSILAQDYTNLRVLARDDGSCDGTVAILNEYATRFPERFCLIANNEGTGHPKWNFQKLMEASICKYVCFADQDDLWLPNKLTLTMRIMKQLEAQHGLEVPLLAFTDLRVVNERLEIMAESYWKLHRINPRHVNHFARLLGQNVVTGCTAMLNRQLVEMASRIPNEADLHDSWVALVASAFGAAMPVPARTVLYRQHDRNLRGAGSPPDQTKTSRSRIYDEQRERWQLMKRQATGMLCTYGDELPAHKHRVLKTFAAGGQSRNRFLVLWNVLRYGMYVPWVRNNAYMLWYLWNRKGKEHSESAV